MSVEAAFLWAQRFAAREWRLLLPVALAFLALPPLIVELVTPASLRAGMLVGGRAPDASAIAAALKLMPVALAALLVSLWGSLTIVALAAIPGISVREAITRGARRLPVLAALGLIATLVMILAALLLGIVLVLARVGTPNSGGIVAGLLLGAALFVWVRLAPIGPIIVERRVGPIAAARLSWELTQGAFWRLLGGLAVYVIGGFVVLLALRYATGSMLILLARLAGDQEVGLLLDLLVFRVGAAVFSTGLQLMLVAFYRQLAGTD